MIEEHALYCREQKRPTHLVLHLLLLAALLLCAADPMATTVSASGVDNTLWETLIGLCVRT